jgi:hypothetical protein
VRAISPLGVEYEPVAYGYGPKTPEHFKVWMRQEGSSWRVHGFWLLLDYWQSHELWESGPLTMEQAKDLVYLLKEDGHAYNLDRHLMEVLL